MNSSRLVDLLHLTKTLKNNFTQCLIQISSLRDGQEIRFKISVEDGFLVFLLKWCKGIK